MPDLHLPPRLTIPVIRTRRSPCWCLIKASHARISSATTDPIIYCLKHSKAPSWPCNNAQDGSTRTKACPSRCPRFVATGWLHAGTVRCYCYFLVLVREYSPLGRAAWIVAGNRTALRCSGVEVAMGQRFVSHSDLSHWRLQTHFRRASTDATSWKISISCTCFNARVNIHMVKF